ncbi:MAG: hypothetical protein ABFQ89_05250, partial [Chloroflexota bacterium]
MEYDLPPLVEKYDSALEIGYIDAGDPVAYELYLAALEEYKVDPVRQGVPAIFIGTTHLVGRNEIQNQLEFQVEKYTDRNGVLYPSLPGLEEYLASSSSVEIEISETGEAIHLLYFSQVGCQDCDRVKGDLNYLKSKYPQLVVDERDVRQDAKLAEWMGLRYGVSEDKRLTAPMVFIGDDYIPEEELEARTLEDLLLSYYETGAEPVWNDANLDNNGVTQSIVERFKAFGPATIVFAGLVDGLNPCAFATLVFFVSYLTISGRKGREVLLVGGAFTLGVFVAYMAVGIGFYNVLDMLGGVLAGLGKVIFGIMGAICLVLAVISFLDYLKARRGEIGEMALNLPHSLRMRINAVIRKSRNSQAFVAGAFATGIV